MRVLVVGGGARESAIVWKLLQSPRLGELFVAPGNPGMMEMVKIIPIDSSDVEGLLQFAKEYKIDITIVGSEEPLALGISDRFQEADLRIFAPSMKAAEIETSKIFAKKLMQDLGIPTASFATFSDYREALNYVNEIKFPSVIKVDGLARGKGVYICKTLIDMKRVLKKIMVDRIHSNAGDSVIIEDFLVGQEISMHLLCDGENVAFLPFIRDYKKVFDGDRGPNTGGMGGYGYLELPDQQRIFNEIIDPILEELVRRNRKFIGCFYPGLIITSDGPKVLEINARFGDPEAQIIMVLLKDDLLDVIDACLDGKLTHINFSEDKAVCINLVSSGYPGVCDVGHQISGIDIVQKIPNVRVFPAGIGYKNNKLVNTEGRVLSVVAAGLTFEEARKRVYEAVDKIYFEGMHYRTDIAKEGT